MLIRAVNTAISAGWLILAVIAVRAVCRRAPRSMICLLWALAALRLACPFSLQSPMSLIPSAETIPEAAVTEAETEAAEPVALDIVDNHIYWALPAPEVHVETAQVRDWTLYGTALWLTGTAALLIYALVSWLKLRRQVAASVRVKGNIFICDWIASPFILGVLRPKIYLPSAMDREQFTYVLAHEHAHLKRGDHWWKPLGFLLLAVYWFQPLVWAAFILFCRDMELACDERVVRDMGMWEKKVYSQILLSCSAPGPMASVCPVSFGGVGVKARIRSVLRFRRPALRAIVGMCVVAIVLAVCFLTDPQEGAAASAEASPAPSATPVVHTVTRADIDALNGTEEERAAPVETPAADLPVLIYHDGKLYTGADQNSLGSLGPTAVLGQISGVVSRDETPTQELETNNPALAGLTVMSCATDERYSSMICVENPDAPNRYSYFVPYEPEKAKADLPVLIYHDGQLYTGVNTNRLGSVRHGEVLGKISGVVPRGEAPAHELETNNQVLEGLTVSSALVWYGEAALCIENPDSPSRYSYFVLYEPEEIAQLVADRAAVEESEESFAALLARMASSGREQMTYEEFAAQYGVELISLDNVPEGYENIGYVFVTAPFEADEPGQGFLAEPVITQMLYNWEERTAITVTQNYTGDSDTPPYFVYADYDNSGRPFADYCWFAYQADYYGGVSNGVSVDMLMRSTRDMVPKDCWLIFRSLWPEG